MEELVQIKSVPSKKIKMSFIITSIVFLILTIIFLGRGIYERFVLNRCYLATVWFIAPGAFIGFLGLLWLFWLVILHCNITITDKDVQGRAVWGKKVFLPIEKISAYSTSGIFSKVSISSASGWVSFCCIENYKEIAEVLKKVIDERRSIETPKAKATPTYSSNLDDLLKLKTLLDNGIITQEEFDKKKKELL